MSGFDPFADPEFARLGQLFLLLLVRIVPIISFTPLFGGPETPAQFRMGFSGLLAAALLLPALPAYPGPVPGDLFVALAAKEAFLGGSVAILIRILFDLLTSSGALIDVARGATIANVVTAPSTEPSTITAPPNVSIK